MDASKLTHVHAHMKYLTIDGESYLLPEKAYKNLSWLNSQGAKHVRILCEFMEPEQRFRACRIKNTILFFGSARARSPEDHDAALRRHTSALENAHLTEEERKTHTAAIDRLKRIAWMCPIYEQVEDLARRLTAWSMERIDEDGMVPYVVSTGGGPGLMEAANKGAASVPGAISAGIAISLPFEAGLNKFVTPELGFQMHYYLSRKYMLCWPSRALVVTAGGFGSMDECFEILTLLQSGKIDHPHLLPIVMFPGSYWKRIVNWQEMVDCGVIAQHDVNLMFFTDSVEDAYKYITDRLLLWEEAAAKAAAAAALAASEAAASAAAAAFAAAGRAAREARRQRGESSELPLPSVLVGGGATSGAGAAEDASPVDEARAREAMPATGVNTGDATPVDGYTSRSVQDDSSSSMPGMLRHMSSSEMLIK